eukprot:gb/GECG01007627.1/.p1 GENE.gb/GECG01007627.1/~~gb/GECG01007627.1/.p1  ORF type:complete len:821 (+),score=119.29 gb/GECG01007627.1/:1-2463(+)
MMASKPKEDMEEETGDRIETVSSPGSDIELVCEHPAGKETRGAVKEEVVFKSPEDAHPAGASKDSEDRPLSPHKVYPKELEQAERNDDIRLAVGTVEPQLPFEDVVVATEKLPEECLRLHPSNFGADGGPVCGCLCCRKSPKGGIQSSDEAEDEGGIEMHPLGVTRQNTPNYASAPPGSQEKPVMYPYNRCTINWCGWIRRLVSKKKRRYIGDGFDLDLSYILNNVVAMGFPSIGVESLYRNPREELQHFLAVRYGKRYKVYNVCCEPQHRYDPAIFSDQVSHFPFEDHNAPPANFMFAFCDDMYRFLLNDRRNVAIIHCKAGKGRTGQMLCCYLLHSGAFDDPEACMSFYADRRTFNRKGVTIPSQRRYIHYYALQLRAIRFKKLSLENKVTVVRNGDTHSIGSNESADASERDSRKTEEATEHETDNEHQSKDGNNTEKQNGGGETSSEGHAEKGEDRTIDSQQESPSANEAPKTGDDTLQPESGEETNEQVGPSNGSPTEDASADRPTEMEVEERDHDISRKELSHAPLGPWTLSMDPRRVPEKRVRILACSFIGNPGPFESFAITVTTMNDYLEKTVICDTSGSSVPHPASSCDENFPEAEEVLPLSAPEGQSIYSVPRSCGVVEQAQDYTATLPESDMYLAAGPPYHLRPERETPQVPLPPCANTITFQGSMFGTDHDIPVSGNVNIELRGLNRKDKKSKKICAFWVHTGFLPLHRARMHPQGDTASAESRNDDAKPSGEESKNHDSGKNEGVEGSRDPLKDDVHMQVHEHTDESVSYGHIVLTKSELDKAVKDKKHKKLPENFSCVLMYKSELD